MYRVETVWNVPTDKRSQNAGPFEKPSIQVSLIALEDDCNPVDLANDDLSNGTASRGAAAAQLTHLNFLPITPEQDDGSIPTIQAIYCKPPNPISYDLNAHETRYSIIVKWEVHQEQHSQLHSSLDQVTSKKKSVSSIPAQNTFLLKRQPDFSLHGVVLDFCPIWYNMLLAFAYSDGAIEFRKRSTMFCLPTCRTFVTRRVVAQSLHGGMHAVGRQPKATLHGILSRYPLVRRR